MTELTYRLLLDQTPDLDAVNGVPAKTYLRLKKKVRSILAYENMEF